MRTRVLWRRYKIDYWARNEYPAEVLDKLLKLDQIEDWHHEQEARKTRT